MTTTGYLFRASWPILDDECTTSMLKAEACRDVDQLAHDVGARIVGDITWTIRDDRLIAQAPALPIAARTPAGHARWGSVTRHAELIDEMLRRGVPVVRIADVLDCTPSAVRKVRDRRLMPRSAVA